MSTQTSNGGGSEGSVARAGNDSRTESFKPGNANLGGSAINTQKDNNLHRQLSQPNENAKSAVDKHFPNTQIADNTRMQNPPEGKPPSRETPTDKMARDIKNSEKPDGSPNPKAAKEAFAKGADDWRKANPKGTPSDFAAAANKSLGEQKRSDNDLNGNKADHYNVGADTNGKARLDSYSYKNTEDGQGKQIESRELMATANVGDPSTKQPAADNQAALKDPKAEGQFAGKQVSETKDVGQAGATFAGAAQEAHSNSSNPNRDAEFAAGFNESQSKFTATTDKDKGRADMWKGPEHYSGVKFE